MEQRPNAVVEMGQWQRYVVSAVIMHVEAKLCMKQSLLMVQIVCHGLGNLQTKLRLVI